MSSELKISIPRPVLGPDTTKLIKAFTNLINLMQAEGIVILWSQIDNQSLTLRFTSQLKESDQIIKNSINKTLCDYEFIANIYYNIQFQSLSHP